VWSLVSASGGDRSPFTVRSGTATGTLGQKPVFNASSRWNGDKTARRVDVSAAFPSVYTDTSTSLTAVRSKAVFQGSFVIPQDMSQTDINEAVAQIMNLCASSLIKTAMQVGYAPA
jgi:hypothetical protein